MWSRAMMYRAPGIGSLDDYTTMLSPIGNPQIDYPLMQIGGHNVARWCDTLVTDGSGSQTISGLTFKPDLVIMCTTTRGNGETYFADSTWLNWGACGPDLSQWSGAISSAYFVSNGYSAWSDASILYASPGNAITITSLNADGFTFSNPANYGGAGCPIGYIAMKLPTGKVKVGTFADGSGSQSISMGLNPSTVWLSSTSNTGTEGDSNLIRIYNGYVDLASNVAFSGNQRNDPFNKSNCSAVFSNTVMPYIRGDGVDICMATPSLVTGGLDLNWSVSDGGGRYWGYVAVEDDEAYDSTPPLGTISSRCYKPSNTIGTSPEVSEDIVGLYGMQASIGFSSGNFLLGGGAYVGGSYYGGGDSVNNNETYYTPTTDRCGLGAGSFFPYGAIQARYYPPDFLVPPYGGQIIRYY